MIKKRISLILVLALGLGLQPLTVVQAATITVNTYLDENNGGCSVTNCSLREAIAQANSHVGADTIMFDISSVQPEIYIEPTSALPTLTDDGTTIDGYTQTGAAPATSGSPATIRIFISGGDTTLANGLIIQSANNRIKGLAIRNFAGNGIFITGAGATGNQVTGNYPGWNGLNGVFIGSGAQSNTIGGDTPAERNVIYGNTWSGVGIWGSETSGNVISGNYIGVNDEGNPSTGNTLDGVWIYGGAHDNIVGGDTAGERNVITSNHRDGVRIDGAATINNLVMGNHIGLKANGAAWGNEINGVGLMGGAHDNLIGGDAAAERNVITGNQVGVLFSGANTENNTVSGNYIGTNSSGGEAEIGNEEAGIRLEGGAHHNLIGGDSTWERNVISGNIQKSPGAGISLVDETTSENTITGNYIGLDAAGTSALPNLVGILIDNATNNLIGGETAALRNVISGNTNTGISISNTLASGNVVSGNYIGASPAGTSAQGNMVGVEVTQGAHDNTIGPGNVISGNSDTGIVLSAGATQTGVIGNRIGANPAGTSALGNASFGVLFLNCSSNTLGGDTEAERNLISGNGYGIVLYTSDGDNTSENVITGNLIGTNVYGTSALGNTHSGIYLAQGARENRIGGESMGEGNVISGNTLHGIQMTNLGTDANQVIGNAIGTDLGRTLKLGNGGHGVIIDDVASRNLISGNSIMHNTGDGVNISGNTTTGNQVSQNAVYGNTGAGINLELSANGNIAAPVITGAGPGIKITGTACSGCMVEVFASENNEGEGQVYLGSVAASGGVFNLVISSIPHKYLTATASEVANGTSEFSGVYTASILYSTFLPMAIN